MSGPMILTGPRPSVRIGMSSSVVIGTGKARVTVESAPVAEWRGPRQQLAVEAPARRVIVGGQGIAGPRGKEGTGVLDFEPRIADLESAAVRTGLLDW